jgi:hypothetical protein
LTNDHSSRANKTRDSARLPNNNPKRRIEFRHCLTSLPPPPRLVDSVSRMSSIDFDFSDDENEAILDDEGESMSSFGLMDAVSSEEVEDSDLDPVEEDPR